MTTLKKWQSGDVPGVLWAALWALWVRCAFTIEHLRDATAAPVCILEGWRGVCAPVREGVGSDVSIFFFLFFYCQKSRSDLTKWQVFPSKPDKMAEKPDKMAVPFKR